MGRASSLSPQAFAASFPEWPPFERGPQSRGRKERGPGRVSGRRAAERTERPRCASREATPLPGPRPPEKPRPSQLATPSRLATPLAAGRTLLRPRPSQGHALQRSHAPRGPALSPQQRPRAPLSHAPRTTQGRADPKAQSKELALEDSTGARWGSHTARHRTVQRKESRMGSGSVFAQKS